MLLSAFILAVDSIVNEFVMIPRDKLVVFDMSEIGCHSLVACVHGPYQSEVQNQSPAPLRKVRVVADTHRL